MVVNGALRAAAQQDELGAVAQRVEDGMAHQFQTFLLIEPADESDDRLLIVGEPETIAQLLLVLVLLINGLNIEMRRDVAVGFGIELIVVQPV